MCVAAVALLASSEGGPAPRGAFAGPAELTVRPVPRPRPRSRSSRATVLTLAAQLGLIAGLKRLDAEASEALCSSEQQNVSYRDRCGDGGSPGCAGQHQPEASASEEACSPGPSNDPATLAPCPAAPAGAQGAHALCLLLTHNLRRWCARGSSSLKRSLLWLSQPCPWLSLRLQRPRNPLSLRPKRPRAWSPQRQYRGACLRLRRSRRRCFRRSLGRAWFRKRTVRGGR